MSTTSDKFLARPFSMYEDNFTGLLIDFLNKKEQVQVSHGPNFEDMVEARLRVDEFIEHIKCELEESIENIEHRIVRLENENFSKISSNETSVQNEDSEG